MPLQSRRQWTTVVFGVIIGFTACHWFILPQVLERKRNESPCSFNSAAGKKTASPGHMDNRDDNREAESRPRHLLYVGVMTAKKYINSRAVAAFNTWVKSIPGKVEFFSSDGSDSVDVPVPLPVVSLAGVDDSYPPQKKSFMMLKYIHDNYLDQYEWFMRADDDVYIRGEKLELFLSSLNSSEPLYLGQTGLGTPEELGKLALEPGENFCMGGPGMIFSREVLRRMVPHIGSCLKEMYTTHEDVEVGRCVRRFAGTQCVWAYETQQLFYENYEHRKGFIEELHRSKIHNAITLHSNKRPDYLYRLHNYMLTREISRLRHSSILLHREGLTMTSLSDTEMNWEDQLLGAPPSYMPYQPSERDDVIEWNFLTGHHIYSAVENKMARQSLGSSLRTALDDIMLQVMEMINGNSKTRGRMINFKEIQYGYYRVDPMHGAEYVLDLLLLYRKHKSRKITVPVRRHAYLQQSFSRPFFCETEELNVAELVLAINSGSRSLSFLSNPLKLLSPFQFYESTRESREQSQREVNILVPLSGRYDTFVRFMENFEQVCLIPKQNVKLSVILVDTESYQDEGKHVQLIKSYNKKYPKADLAVIPLTGNFSRGFALQLGSSLSDNGTLLFFCDVDLIFNADALQRCRDNTVQGRQVFFPIVFSQYDPSIVYADKAERENKFGITIKSGFWRDYGFGIACVFKSDLLEAGGFDTSILGWGLEDVDLFTKVVQSGLKVFRSQEPGMIHIYHPVHCSPGLDPKQLKMCLGSKSSTYASTMHLAEMWMDKHIEVGYNRTSS
ncbi:chondroitin sulfate synthase 3-like [Entelurus aequoreus]|uniref:chondroitin sulfate synthase 3-like n=1 Tax=Entelurus aequoreus TaxID=161455 RepID=UPI002B1E4AF8|nr:chondroitin sulfate synthase 3-like [Entelurus aequoreus]